MTSMRALVYAGIKQKSFEDRPKPAIQAPTDAIVRTLEAKDTFAAASRTKALRVVITGIRCTTTVVARRDATK